MVVLDIRKIVLPYTHAHRYKSVSFNVGTNKIAFEVRRVCVCTYKCAPIHPTPQQQQRATYPHAHSPIPQTNTTSLIHQTVEGLAVTDNYANLLLFKLSPAGKVLWASPYGEGSGEWVA